MSAKMEEKNPEMTSWSR